MNGSALFEGYGWGWSFDFACMLLIGATIWAAFTLRARGLNLREARIKSRDEARPIRSAMASDHDV